MFLFIILFREFLNILHVSFKQFIEINNAENLTARCIIARLNFYILISAYDITTNLQIYIQIKIKNNLTLTGSKRNDVILKHDMICKIQKYIQNIQCPRQLTFQKIIYSTIKFLYMSLLK